MLVKKKGIWTEKYYSGNHAIEKKKIIFSVESMTHYNPTVFQMMSIKFYGNCSKENN